MITTQNNPKLIMSSAKAFLERKRKAAKEKKEKEDKEKQQQAQVCANSIISAIQHYYWLITTNHFL